MILRKRLESRGDTIVEVLIAMAVMSLVLAGAYVTTHKSSIATRDAQERSQALKLLESQIESIRNIANSSSKSQVFPASSNFFCIADDGQTVSPQSGSNTLPALDADTYSTTAPGNVYPAACVSRGDDKLYNITISYDNSSNNSTFSLTNRWDKLGGGKDQVTLVYRIYP